MSAKRGCEKEIVWWQRGPLQESLTLHTNPQKKTALVAVKQGAVVKRKSLRSISIAVAPTTRCLKWLHELTNLDGIFEQPRP